MKLSDLLTESQLGAMRSAANGVSEAETLCPSICSWALTSIHLFLGENDCVPTTAFWRDLERNYGTFNRCVVIIANKRKLEIVELNKSRAFANWLGNRLHEGDGLLLVLRNYKTEKITWDNWKDAYNRITFVESDNGAPAQPTSHEKRQIRSRRRRERMFSECATVNMPKKMNKRGFNMTVSERFALHALQELEDAKRDVLYQAKKIYELCNE